MDDFKQFLTDAGLSPDSSVYCSVRPSDQSVDSVELEVAIRNLIGPAGTILAPAFSHSFARNEVYCRKESPSLLGNWSEHIRMKPVATRSSDPLYSVSGVGPRAESLLDGDSQDCFGPDSIWSRLMGSDSFLIFIGEEPTRELFVRSLEYEHGCDHRYRKLYPGIFQDDDCKRKGSAIDFCIDATNDETQVDLSVLSLVPNYWADFSGYKVLAISGKELGSFIRNTLAQQPYAFCQAGVSGTTPVLIARELKQLPPLSPQSTPYEMVEAVWQMPRDIVSEGYDRALFSLQQVLPFEIHEIPTGTECWSWFIPERWTCHEARLESTSGQSIFDYEDHPLHVMSYSLPFEGTISRQELFDHLWTNPKVPKGIPFRFKYYERDWGLCCTDEQKQGLTDESYRVVIRSEFSYNTLKVGDYVLPGESEETFVFCAHLCHPAQVNDDLTGVVAGIEVMRRLAKIERRRYTYRLLILPETIGSIAYLSQNESLIPNMVGGLFLEMLGLDQPHSLQRSFVDDHELDRLFSLIVKETDPDSWEGGFQKVISNDERQFAAPGIRVPMLSLSRVLSWDQEDWPFREYHTHFDDLDRFSESALNESISLVVKMVSALEDNLKPRNRFRGELYCSRFGFMVDDLKDITWTRALFDVLHHLDGEHTLLEIAESCNAELSIVKEIVDQLKKNGIVTLDS